MSVCHTIGISDHATAGGLLGLLLHLFITVFLSSTVGTADEKAEGLFEWKKSHEGMYMTSSMLQRGEWQNNRELESLVSAKGSGFYTCIPLVCAVACYLTVYIQ